MPDESSPSGCCTIRMLSTLALMGAMPQLASRYGEQSGVRLAADFAPTNALIERIRSGESADVAILTRQGVDELSREGIFASDTCSDIALSFIGIAVRHGAPRPNIASAQACRAALLDARSIAYSRIGASGVFFAQLIKQLGIEQRVNARARIVPGGFTAKLVADGEADLAVQQVSELMVVPGIDVVGRFPIEWHQGALFSAGVFAASSHRAAAIDLLRFLGSAEAAPLLRASGLEPPDPLARTLESA